MRGMIRLLVAALATTSSLEASVIISQNFEAGSPPSGWTSSHNTPSVGWEFGTSLGSSYFPIADHTRYAASNDDAHDDNSTTANVADRDRLITPTMNLSFYAGQAVLLSFAYVQPGTYGSTGSVEVSTNGGNNWVELATVTPSATWTTGNVALTAYTAYSSVMVAFRHNDHGYWADGFAVDDVVVQSLLSRDAGMEGLGLPTHIATGTRSILASVTNWGGSTITSLGFTYSVNGGAAVAGVAGGLNIATGASAVVTHPTQYSFAPPGSYAIDLQITSVNGLTDLNAANNAASGNVEVLSRIPTKVVVLEQHTGAWCQFCPDGTVIFDQARALGPAVIGVSGHNGDSMEIADGTTIQAAYISGYPGGTVDRFLFADATEVEVNRGAWISRINERLDDVVPAEVALESVSYNAGTRQLTATVRASFVGGLSGDLRFNLWVVEDGVVGSGTGYNQVNYYNTVAGHPYYGAGNPIVGFVHDGVVRAMLGGPWGTGGEIPGTVGDGDTFTTTYQYTLPAGVDPAAVRLVGLLQEFDADPNQRELVNATQRPLLPLFADGFESGSTSGWSSVAP